MPLSLEQQEARKNRVGGSDMATILGLSKWRTPYELFLQKTGEIPYVEAEEESPADWGNILEPAIAKKFEARSELNGNLMKTRRHNAPIINDEFPWLVANIDRDIVGQKTALEIKNVNWRMGFEWGPDGTDQVVQEYLPQPMLYMLVMNLPTFHVAALIGGSDLRTYELKRDKEWDELILEASHEFIYEHVLKGIPPEIEWAHRTTEDLLKKMYMEADGTEIVLSEEMSHWHSVLEQIKSEIKELSIAEKVAKNHIVAAMGNSSIGIMPDGSQYIRAKTKRAGFYVAPNEFVVLRHKKARKPKTKGIEDGASIG